MFVEWNDLYNAWCVTDDEGYVWYVSKSEQEALDYLAKMENDLGYL